MNFLQALAGRILPSIKSQTDPRYNQIVFGSSGFQGILSNSQNDQKFIEEGYQKNATVFAIIDKIQKAATNVKLEVFKKKDRGALKQYETLTSGSPNDFAMFKAEQLKMRALKPAPDSELQELLDRPNPDQGYAEWITNHIGFKLLTGDSFIYGLRPNAGQNGKKIKQMYIMPSHLMQIHGGGLMTNIDYYTLTTQYGGMSDKQVRMEEEDVAHIKNFNPDYTSQGAHLYGQSPLKAAYRNLIMNNESINTGMNLLHNQGARGILSSDDQMPVTQEQLAEMKQRYKATYGGSGNAGDIMITSKMFKWINMGLPAADLALIEQYNLSIKDLANVYNVPSILLNDTTASTFNNYREAKKQLYLEAVFPELISLRDELNRWLAPSYGKEYYIDFDFMSVPELQEDMESVAKQMSLSWWITPNEKRQMMKLDPLDQEGMDEVYILANYYALTDGVTTREQGATSHTVLGASDDYLKKGEDD